MLLRSLRSRVEKQWGPAGSAIVWAAAEGRDLDTVFYLPCQSGRGGNPAGVYRSLLGQLFPHDPRLRRALLSLSEKRLRGLEGLLPFSDAELVSFFLEEYITHPIETPTKRTFIFVDVADDCAPSYLADLLSHLSQLAHSSDFTICVASNHYSSITHPNALEIVMREHNADDIARYVSLNLLAEWEGRNATVHRVAERSNGVFLWAEIVVNILNAAIEEGAMQELIDETITELPAEIEGLYEWILGTLSEQEKEDCLALMQWVILAPEPLRLNDLRIAVRLTRPWGPRSHPEAAMEVNAPTSLRQIRRPGSATTFDSPYQFHRFMRSRSVGLLELRESGREGGREGGGVSHEPLGLQRVQVIHDSVAAFFVRGRGYECLAGERATRGVPFCDAGHYVLLRACLDYLNLTDFASLGNAPLSPPPPPSSSSLPPLPLSPPSSMLSSPPGSPDARSWRRNVTDQRHLVASSYPFLQYAVSNLLYHLLSPTPSRVALPQLALLRALARDNMRLYRRWTALLGAATPAQVLGASGSAAGLLARFPAGRTAVERVLGALWRLSVREVGGAGSAGPGSPSEVSEGSAGWSAGVVWTPLTPMSFDKALAAF